MILRQFFRWRSKECSLLCRWKKIRELLGCVYKIFRFRKLFFKLFFFKLSAFHTLFLFRLSCSLPLYLSPSLCHTPTRTYKQIEKHAVVSTFFLSTNFIFLTCSKTWGQFHQCFMSSFFLCRSQMYKKALMTWLSFCAFVIIACKNCT